MKKIRVHVRPRRRCLTAHSLGLLSPALYLWYRSRSLYHPRVNSYCHSRPTIMSFRFYRLAALAAFLLFSGVFFPAAAAPAIGQPAPDFSGPDLVGAPLDLSALRGKVAIVHFWATWCPSCREEMPILDAFYVQHHAQGVEVIGITVDRPRARGKAVAYMKGFHFPAALLDDAVKNGFGTPGALPVTYVIDRRGIVRAIFTPEKALLSASALEGAVLPLAEK